MDDRNAHPDGEADPADVVGGLVAHGLRDGVLALGRVLVVVRVRFVVRIGVVVTR